ncbi:FAD/NAD(P)-binding domain-containing protein [Hypoxylon sp. FL1857]|nr:FAD/NAD(P)-binding domain-containing protein [Hypoxylon sp. FL1857]
MAADKIQKVDVAIIGAGWYGLVAARTYLRLQPTANVLIIDSDNTVGGVWSKDRLYPNLVAQVRLGLFNYSDTPMRPNGGDAKDPRVTGDMIHNYLQKYAEDHDLLRRIRFNTFVTDAKQIPGGWRLSFRNTDDQLETAKLMVATGVTSIPYMPKLEDSDGKIPIIHSRDLGTAFDELQNDSIKDVIVVGAAKSAYDAVYLLLRMGKKVTWVIRKEGGGPLSILPFKILNTVNAIAFASTRLMTHLSPSILNTKGPMYWLMQRTGVGRWCVGRFWDFLNYVSGVHAGYGDGDHVAELKPEIDRQGVFWAHSGLGVVTLPDFWSTLHSPNLTVLRDVVESTQDRKVTLKSGAELNADYIIMCTGWGDHFALFDAEHKAKIGLPAYEGHPVSPISEDGVDWEYYDEMADKLLNERLPFLAKGPNLVYPKSLDPKQQKKWRLYRRAIPLSLAQKNDRSLAILGQIHTVQTPLVSEVQTLWAILYLLGEIDLPDVDTMAMEVALWNAWTRKRYLNQGQKFPYSLYDFLPYIDSVFSDLGLKSRRKSNAISELLSPYHPHDFNGFVDEYLERRAKAQKSSTNGHVPNGKKANGVGTNGKATNGHSVTSKVTNGHAS